MSGHFGFEPVEISDMIPCTLISALEAAADEALVPILQNGATCFGQTPPSGEVGFVAAVVLGGVPAIADAWRPILAEAGFRLAMHGVFCHQVPKVSFMNAAGETKSCELADLLIVIDDLTLGRPNKRWASLIQAKMAQSSGGTTIATPNDVTQLDLFMNWPEFELQAGYQKGLRNFSNCPHPGVVTDCGWYGLITNSSGLAVWRQQRPQKIMPPDGTKLGTFIANMLKMNQTDFGREATGNKDDWSRTVEELMNLTYAKFFNYASGFGKGNPQKRGYTALVCDYAPLLSSWMDKYSFLENSSRVYRFGAGRILPPEDGEPEDGEPEDGGISILRIGVARDE